MHGLVLRLRRAVGRVVSELRDISVKVHPCPILILGNQKSGTTAIAGLLAEMTGQPATLDLAREMREPSFHRVRSGSMSMRRFIRRNKRDFSRPIVKEPNFVVLFEELRRYFPESSVVFVARDPRDNIRSILNRLGVAGNLDQWKGPYRGLHAEAWNLYLDGNWLGIEGETYVDWLAQRWNLASDVYLAHPGRLILIRYEDFLADKVGEIGRLAERLGLSRKRDIADLVDVPFQRPGDREISWPEFFGPHNLARIEQRCVARMVQLGYAPSLTCPSSGG